tara:strand:- start:51 stop:518 length:468 start_codon:yes stop_codon:yes gene_type:complete
MAHTDFKKVSDIRLNKIDARRTLANGLERASEFTMSYSAAAGNAATTHIVGVAHSDCEFIGGRFITNAATNGDAANIVVKKDSDADPSNGTAISASLAMSDAAAAVKTLTALTTTAVLVDAGDSIGITIDGDGLAGDYIVGMTLYFKTVDNVDNS